MEQVSLEACAADVKNVSIFDSQVTLYQVLSSDALPVIQYEHHQKHRKSYKIQDPGAGKF